MAFDSSVYLQAAEERASLLHDLVQRDIRDYVMAHYIAGLAVESLLRAYHWRIKPGEIYTYHDLRTLKNLSEFDAYVPDGEREQFANDFAVIVRQWDNLLRFYSTEELRSELKARKLNRKIGRESKFSGDYMEHRTRQIVNSAIRIVSLGVLRWTK